MFAMVKKDSQQEAVKIQENNFISEASPLSTMQFGRISLSYYFPEIFLKKSSLSSSSYFDLLIKQKLKLLLKL